MFRPLYDYMLRSAAARAQHRAIEDELSGEISYGGLAALSARLRDRLVALGVRPGDRVGVFLPKSTDAVAALHGIMRAGAAYVPADPLAPATRAAFIHGDCGVSAAIVHARVLAAYRAAWGESGAVPPLIVVEEGQGGPGIARALDAADQVGAAAPARDHPAGPDELAYILYTSGSTGRPKGVMLTHLNAVSFVEWCAETFHPTASDRFSSHAPLHFDLSILDLYLCFRAGATLVLVPEEVGKDPVRLAPFIAARRISNWYSAPSVLGLLAQFGNLPQHDLSSLRQILFAGEVFPIKHLRALKLLLPKPEYFNLYGPTETNVCTWYRVPDEIPEDRVQPLPIGPACPHLQTMVIDEHGRSVAAGGEGELVVHGPAVTQGYWNLPERNAVAFHVGADGRKWYRTGDIVIEGPEGYVFLGRRDRMVKKRGYRIELGEIESCLYQHPGVKEAGVIATSNEDGDVQILAFLSTDDGRRLSVIALKSFVAQRLPLYMVPDRFLQQPALPRTSTDKVDYQRLKAQATAGAA
jgi:amino acid adenylation domain-containing protein